MIRQWLLLWLSVLIAVNGMFTTLYVVLAVTTVVSLQLKKRLLSD